MEDNGFVIYVGNYADLNEGNRIYVRLELPMDSRELAQKIIDAGIYQPDRDEFFIADYDRIPFLCNSVFNEYADIFELNRLAEQIDAKAYYMNKVEALLNSDIFDGPETLTELMNLIEQAEDIQFYKYDFEPEPMTLEKDFAYSYIQNWRPELHQMLDKIPGAMNAFDYEKYFECELSYSYELQEDGYIVKDADIPDLDRYDKEDFYDWYQWYSDPDVKSSSLTECLHELYVQQNDKAKSTEKTPSAALRMSDMRVHTNQQSPNELINETKSNMQAKTNDIPSQVRMK